MYINLFLKKVKIFSVFCLIILGFWSCSTQKDRFLNREYHSLNTKFNVLFNGEEALEIGTVILASEAQDDFLNVLPVELITLDGEDENTSAVIPSFIRAEEKAVKAIQKHSMNFNGKQKNDQINKAYLLLGKARYYDRRFFPALEAFNFLLGLSSEADVFYEGKLWREKTNIRLRNDELAVSNLKPLALTMSKKRKLYAEVNATLAQAFLNIQQVDSALKYIKIAADTERKRTTQTRYRFIEAQLFEKLNQKDSAQYAFSSIVDLKRKAPRLYWMHAKLNALRIQSEISGESPEKALEKLSNAFENENFNHLIYRQQAQYYLSQGKDSLAKQFFNKSLRSPSIDRPTRRQNYRDLADEAFAQGDYVVAGAYLDSLLGQFLQESRQKKIVVREREGLQDVIVFEKTIRVADSILMLTSMQPEEQLAYYQKAIDQKRAKEFAKIELQKKPLIGILNRSNQKKFYFYNENLVVLGKQEFASNFGNRPNTDNWNRIESLNRSIVSNQKEENVETEQIPIVKENAQSYVNLLPKSSTFLDSLSNQRNQAYLEVGILYKEKFKNTFLANDRLKKLLVSEPNENQQLNAWYHLYKMNEIDQPKMALVYKDKIVREYPESRFARIISDPENFKLKENETPQIRYESLYQLYLNQQYEEVLSQGEDLMIIFSGSPLVSKVAHLMANSLGRLEGVESWKEKLKNLIETYPNSEASSQAKSTLATLEITNQSEKPTKVYLNYKLIFPILKENQNQFQELSDEVNRALIEAKISFGSITSEVYDRDYIFLVVNDLREKPNTSSILNDKTQTNLSTAFSNKFVVLSSQYKDIQLFKSWKAIQ